MSDISFNEINRLLSGRIDPVLLKVILELYLMFEETQRQSSLNARVALNLVESMSQIVALHKTTQDMTIKLQRSINPSGIDFKSVPYDQDDN